MSLMRFAITQVINKVGTSITKSFVHQHMHHNSPVMKLRLTHDEAVSIGNKVTCDQNPNSPLEFKEPRGEFSI